MRYAYPTGLNHAMRMIETFTCVLINLTFRVETCFLSMLGLRAILFVLLGQYKGRNMLSINVRAKGNTGVLSGQYKSRNMLSINVRAKGNTGVLSGH